jgi:carbon-monoxide dehydrogenase medium subunit
VIPASFDYARPATLDEALRLLSRPGAKALAGGMSLLPLLKLRVAHVDRLVDIGRLAELRGARQLDGGGYAIGALTTYDEFWAMRGVQHFGLFRDAIPHIGDVQVRNRGTLGGAVAHADPNSDLPACLLAIDAHLGLRTSRGERVVALDGFYTGPFASGLEPDELVIDIRLPAPREDAGSAYASLDQAASGYALVGVAAVVLGDGSARVAVTGVGEVPYRAKAVEAALATGASFAEAAGHATDGQTVNSDIHADAEYRAAMAVVYCRRALEAAKARLG